MDILTFGSKRIYRNLGSFNKKTLEINLDDILEKINLDYNQFIELCILFGCDYCDRIKDISPDDLYNTYIKYKNIKDTFNHLKQLNYNIPELDNIDIIKEYFKNPPVLNDIESLDLYKPNLEKLEDKLVNEYGLIKSKIMSKINFLKRKNI